jgi:hypothetical protein
VVAGLTDDTENLGFTIDPVGGKIVDEWAPRKVRTINRATCSTSTSRRLHTDR